MTDVRGEETAEHHNNFSSEIIWMEEGAETEAVWEDLDDGCFWVIHFH